MSNRAKHPWSSFGAFAAVAAAHAAAIGYAFWSPSPKTEEIILPTIQGILIPAPPAEQVQMPSAAPTPPPEPTPVEPEPPKPQPKPKPKPEPKPKTPPVKAPPSERSITQEEIREEETAPPPPSQPVQPSVPVDTQDSTLGAPVTPPRMDANPLNNPAPAYPTLSRRMREQGTVLLEILIKADGSVGEVRIKESSGFRRLDETAMKAVQRWRYVPAQQGNKPIEYWYVQPVDFTLN